MTRRTVKNAQQKLAQGEETLNRADHVIKELRSQDTVLRIVLGDEAYNKLVDKLETKLKESEGNFTSIESRIKQLLGEEKKLN